MRVDWNDELGPWVRFRALDTGALIVDVLAADEAAGTLEVLSRDGHGRLFQEEDPERPGRARAARITVTLPFEIELRDLSELPPGRRGELVRLFAARRGGAVEGAEPSPEDQATDEVVEGDPAEAGDVAAPGDDRRQTVEAEQHRGGEEGGDGVAQG